MTTGQRQVTAELARGRHGESSGQTSVLAPGETQKVYNMMCAKLPNNDCKSLSSHLRPVPTLLCRVCELLDLV